MTTDSHTIQQMFRGGVIGREHTMYDEARKLYNGMIDKHPLLIVRCADVGDVITAVRFAGDQGLLLAIRGGGHNGIDILHFGCPGFSSVLADCQKRFPLRMIDSQTRTSGTFSLAFSKPALLFWD